MIKLDSGTHQYITSISGKYLWTTRSEELNWDNELLVSYLMQLQEQTSRITELKLSQDFVLCSKSIRFVTLNTYCPFFYYMAAPISSSRTLTEPSYLILGIVPLLPYPSEHPRIRVNILPSLPGIILVHAGSLAWILKEVAFTLRSSCFGQ